MTNHRGDFRVSLKRPANETIGLVFSKWAPATDWVRKLLVEGENRREIDVDDIVIRPEHEVFVVGSGRVLDETKRPIKKPVRIKLFYRQDGEQIHLTNFRNLPRAASDGSFQLATTSTHVPDTFEIEVCTAHRPRVVQTVSKGATDILIVMPP